MELWSLITDKGIIKINYILCIAYWAMLKLPNIINKINKIKTMQIIIKT